MSTQDYLKKLQNISYKNALVILVLITFLSHITYIFNGFTWLDHIDIEQKNALYPPTKILRAFVEPYSATHFYRALVAIAHTLDSMLYGTNPTGFHFTNILIHLGVVLLLFHLLYRFLNNHTFPAIIGTIIFSVHPLNSLSIGAISYRTDLLATFFTLLAFLAYLKYQENKQVWQLVSSALIFFFALCSKETALLWFPLILIMFHICTKYKLGNRKQKTCIIATYSCVLILFFVLRSFALTDSWQFKHAPLSLPEHIGTRLATIPTLLSYLALPFPPPISDTVKTQSLLSLFSLIGLCSIIALIYIYRKTKDTRLKTLVLFCSISVLPALNIIPLPRFISPHYLYFTNLAISFLIVAAIDKYTLYQKRIFWILLLIWLIIATTSTFLAGFRFKNDHTLFAPEATKDPHFKEGLLYLGNYYTQQNQLDKAAAAYQSILKTDAKIIAFADPTSARINLANVYLQQARYLEAEETVNQALGSVPKNSRPDLQYNLALILFIQGKFQPTIDLITETQLNHKVKPAAALLLTEAYLKTGQKEQAQKTLNEIKNDSTQPPYSEIYATLEKQLK